MADRAVLDFRPGSGHDLGGPAHRRAVRDALLARTLRPGSTLAHPPERRGELRGHRRLDRGERDWRKVEAGERAVVPVGVRHTLRPDPDSDRQAKMINAHIPGLEFETLFRRFHHLASTGSATLPPTNLASLFNVAILFSDHPEEIRSARPPQQVLDVLAWIGRRIGYGPEK